jgi:hypothetical protein
MMNKTIRTMVVVSLASCFLWCCGPKPYYETKEGKKKQKHYNKIQFGTKN